MQKKALIKQGWLRALVFLISFLLILSILIRIQNLVIVFLHVNRDAKAAEQAATSQFFVFLMLALSSLASILTVFIFRKLVDRQTLKSLGLEYSSFIPHGLSGFFLALLLLGAGTFVLITTGYLHWIDLNFKASEIFLSLGMMLIIAISEELVFRGYILNNLMQSMHSWLALVISAILFAAFHGFNPGLEPLALVNLFLGGLLLGANYIYTKNLWFAICFHFCWNFYQGSILGYKVSGLGLSSVFQQEVSGPNLITGGNFGFEGSILSGVLCLIATILLVWIYENKKKKEVLPSLGVLQ